LQTPPVTVPTAGRGWGQSTRGVHDPTPHGEGGEEVQEAAHKEAPQRVHALHEGDEGEGNRGMHTQGVGRHQPDPWAQGTCRPALIPSTWAVYWFLNLIYIICKIRSIDYKTVMLIQLS